MSMYMCIMYMYLFIRLRDPLVEVLWLLCIVYVIGAQPDELPW